MKPFREAVEELICKFSDAHVEHYGKCDEDCILNVEELTDKLLTAFEELVPERDDSQDATAHGFNGCRAEILNRLREAREK